MSCGRFAPSPTGDLHLGNLRTALVAWLAARSTGGRFLVRMEDLDRRQSSREIAEAQLDDLARFGLDWDGEVHFQSDRFARYDEVIDDLEGRGLLYPCFCSRREIREAASAPHGHHGEYPGTCRDLTASQRRRRRDEGRPPALRLRGPVPPVEIEVVDAVYGPHRGPVDDVVVRRNDGVVSYNLAVVVDDADMGVTEVVRGDDLLSSVPRQLHIAAATGLAPPSHAHVPLVMAPHGERLAKRHGAVTLSERLAAGDTSTGLVGVLAHSVGLTPTDRPVPPAALIDEFSWSKIPTRRWVAPDAWLAPDRDDPTQQAD